MAQKKVVLVGHDAAPSKAFELVKAELQKRDCSVTIFLGHGKAMFAEVDERHIGPNSDFNADYVLLGMSAPADNAAEEIAIAEYYKTYGIPFSFYADTFGAWKRQWFQHLLPNAKYLFVLNENEREGAQKAFPNVQVVIAGNHEWEAACFPNYSREQIRQKLAIINDEVCIFVPGHKSVTISAFLLMGVVHALNHVVSKKWRVIFAPHPGDGVSPKSYAEPMLYTSSNIRVEIIARDKFYSKVIAVSGEPKFEELNVGLPSSDLLPAADLVIESASTFCQAAALQRIPIISFLSEVSKQRNVSVFGQREWEPVLQGVSKEVCGDPNELGHAIVELLYSGTSRLVMRDLQIALYPGLKERGQFAKTIADAVLS